MTVAKVVWSCLLASAISEAKVALELKDGAAKERVHTSAIMQHE